MFLTRTKYVLVVGALVVVLVAAARCDPGRSGLDAGNRVEIRVSPPKLAHTDSELRPAADPTALSADDICRFVRPAAVEHATGVSGLLNSTVVGEEGSNGRPLICKFSDPNGPPEAYGTVNLVYDPSTVLAPKATVFGLPGGRIDEPTPADRVVDGRYGGLGRAQTRVSWVHQRHAMEVDGRGPAVTAASMLALAQEVDAHFGT